MSLDFSQRAALGNIQWTASGATATFVTPTRNLRFTPAAERLSPAERWTALYAAVGSTFRHSAVDRLVPVSAVMDRMAAAAPGGKDAVSEFPSWQTKMAETADFLGTLAKQPTEKWTVLTVDLPGHRVRPSAATWWGARALFGLPPTVPDEREQQRARAEADRLYGRLRTLVPGLRPAAPGELRWLAAHAQTFGGIEPPFTHPVFTDDSDELTLVAPLGDAILNPDGHHSNYVSIDAPLVPDVYDSELPPSLTQRVYQTFMVVNDFAQMWRYPDAALWDDLDDLDQRVCGTIVARYLAPAAARAKLDGLFKHTRWVQDTSGANATPDVDTAVAHEDLIRELAALAGSGGPSTPSAYVLRLAATDPDELEDMVRNIRGVMDPTQTRFARPRGMQTRIWLAMLPGSARTDDLRRYERHVHPRDLAGLGLYHGHELGDPEGRLYALTLGAEDAHPRLVFRNPMRGPRSEHGNSGATRGNIGDLGGGKSLDVKTDADQVLDLGGGVVAVDLSEEREWQRAAQAFSTKVTVIDPSAPGMTFDPLRTFTSNLPDDPQKRLDSIRLAERHTVGFFALRLSLATVDDDRHDALVSAVQDLLADDPPLPPTSPNLLTLLRYRAGDPDLPPQEDRRFRAETSASALSAAEVLVKRLTNLARSGDKGRSIMGDGESLDLTAPCVIFSDPGVDLGTLEGRASMYLANAYSMAFLHATPRFNLACLTELGKLSADPWGKRLEDDLLRESRRAHAGLSSDTQRAKDYTNPQLIIERTAAKTRDEQGAIDAAIFCGAEPTPAVTSRLRTLETPMKLFRDRYGRVGFVEVLRPVNDDTFLWFRTDPDALREQERRLRERVEA
jgi:hypothetical protein